jgi:uncharacterized ferritin-like protein (DUF455 family)
MTLLQSSETRDYWMRLGTAQILKRVHFCERSLVISCSAWLPLIGDMEQKTLLPLFSWQNAETAHELRERIFELQFPNREIDEEGVDRPLVELFDELRNSPSPMAFFTALASVLLPALRDAYDEYLRHSDPLSDAPTHRFLRLALAEKCEQIAKVQSWADKESARRQEDGPGSEGWTSALKERLRLLGGIGTDHAPADLPRAPLPGGRPYSVPVTPVRDDHYRLARFYWPDNVDPSFPYGEGRRLQLRSAVSHLNEVWAVETGGVILSAFAALLGWEWIHDAARWTYDESRHCRMGRDRLIAWGYKPEELPLGSYIYDSAAGQDPIYRLGLLFFFETKNIGHKTERIKAFHAMGDTASERNMDFDWADETMHTSYGRKWLEKLMEIRGEDPANFKDIRKRCSELIQATVKTVKADELKELQDIAAAIMAKAD